MFPTSLKRLSVLFALLAVVAVSFASVSPVFAESGGTAQYTVQGGENLTRIANRFDISVEKLLSVNPLITDPNLILSGQVITLPAGRGEGTVKPSAGRIFYWNLEKNGNKINGADRFYLVKGGDNLTKIAKAYGLTLEKLLLSNPQIDNQNLLFSGELIRIPMGVNETAPNFYHSPGGLP
jgi:LysM repeat protein